MPKGSLPGLFGRDALFALGLLRELLCDLHSVKSDMGETSRDERWGQKGPQEHCLTLWAHEAVSPHFCLIQLDLCFCHLLPKDF